MSSNANLSLITNYGELKEFFSLIGKGEPRNTEYKNGNEWDLLKFKITKALIALSNLRDGGKVIVGISEDLSVLSPLIGMSKDQSKTFTRDNIMQFVNEYADPPIEIKMHMFSNEEERYFIVINVLEFSDQPIICKRDGGEGILQREKIYTRPRKKTESSDNFSHHDMRELIELATEKYHVRQMKTCEKFENLKSQEDEDKKIQEKFDEEVSDF